MVSSSARPYPTWPSAPRRRSSEFVEQPLGVPKVGGVKALGEPPVDGSQKVVRLPPLAPIGPEPRERDGGPQLPPPGALLPGHLDRLEEAGLGSRAIRDRIAEERLAPEAVQLRLEAAAVGTLHDRQRLGQQDQRLRRIPGPDAGLGQHAEER